MLTEQLMTLETLTEQPKLMKLEMLTEQLTTAAKVQVAMEPKVCTHKLQSGHLHPCCHTCRGRAWLGC